MKPVLSTAPLFAALLLAASAANAQSLNGTYDLSGRQGRRSAKAEVKIRAQSGKLTIERTGSFTSRTFASQPAFRWSAEVKTTSPTTFYALYNVGVSGGASGAIGGASAQPPNVFMARYTISSDGQQLSERITNLTRRGDQRFWRTASLRGAKRPLPPVADLAAKAKSQSDDMVEFLFYFYTSIADYYSPGDEDDYDRDYRNAKRDFRAADYVEVPVPQQVLDDAPASRKPVKAFKADLGLGGGTMMVLFDANGEVYDLVYDEEGYLYTEDGDEYDPIP